MNTTQHLRTPPSRIERLLTRLAHRREVSDAPAAWVDLIHDSHVVPTPGDR